MRTGRAARRPEARSKCCKCSASIGYRKWGYTCTACTTLLCQRCARTQQNTEPAVAATALPEAVPEALANDDMADLLRMLRDLPAAFPHAPLLWIPRQCKQQVGSILRQLIFAAARCVAAAPGDERAEAAHLLAEQRHNCSYAIHHRWRSKQETGKPAVQWVPRLRRSCVEESVSHYRASGSC